MSKDKTKQIRQGDVFLTRIEKLPAGLKKIQNGLIVEGEATNHAHYGVGCDVLVAEDGKMFIDVSEEAIDASIKHLLMNTGVWTGEHTDVKVAPGVYEIMIHQQYNPFAKAIEKVKD